MVMQGGEICKRKGSVTVMVGGCPTETLTQGGQHVI